MKRMLVLSVVVGLIGCLTLPVAAAQEVPKEAVKDFLTGIKRPTRLISEASQACWSPDGTRICYTRHPGGADSAGGISVLVLDGSGRTQEITPDGKDATWSPDGKWIAYLREGERGLGESVWLIQADGQGDPVFLDEGGSVYWSRDSKSVIYHSRRYGTVYRMPIAEGEREGENLLSVPYAYPRPSPDGKEIAYIGSEGLCVSAIDGSDTRSKSVETGGFCGGWSPDGKMIAYGGFFGSGLGLRVIDASLEGEPKVLLPGHWSRPSWSPDGKFIVYDTMAEPLSVWIMNVEQLASAAPEGKPIVSAVEEALAPQPQVLSPTPIWAIRYPDEVYCVAFSPDGKGLLAGSADGTLKLWDVKTGEEIRSYPGHDAKVASVVISSDGNRLVTGSWDRTAKLWDAATGEVIRTFSGHTDCLEQADLSPDGTKVATSSWDGTAKLWDAAAGEEIRTLHGHRQTVDWVEFSPDGKKVVTAGYDGTARLWDVETGEEIRVFSGHTGPVHAARFSRDGSKLLTVSTDTTVRLWDVETGKEIRTFHGHSTTVWSCAFSPDETKIATGGSYEKTAKVWDVATGEVIRTFAGHNGNVDQVAFSPDGTKLASACHDKVLRLWDVEAGAVPERKVTATEGERAPPEPQVLAFDDFDGKLSLDWHILKADPTHFSLSRNPGMLTITTQRGALGAERKDYRNLFVIDCPTKLGADFEITTCIVSFKPVRNWNQAGLICYNDDDHFLKWVYEWTGDNVGNPRRTFTRGRETAGRPAYEWLAAPQKLEKVWLRLSKQGNSYTFRTSLDGKLFRSQGARTWGNGSVKQVGLLAKNGTPSTAPDIDALFDFFEVKAFPAEAAGGPWRLPKVETGKFGIPEENLQIPEEMQACAAKLRKIGGAIKQYEKDKGKLPNRLSDLVSDYISAETLLCPHDPTYRAPHWPDPKLPCSYMWELSLDPVPSPWPAVSGMVCREWKSRQVRLLGDVVPMVRCLAHGYDVALNLSVGGQIYSSPYHSFGWERVFIPDYSFGDEMEVEEAPAPPAEVEREAVRPAEVPKRKFEIPEENRQIPGEMRACAAKLRKIFNAINKYEKDKGKLPDWLSDLVPDYLGKDALLCPDDTTYTTMTCVDPELPCSYNYEFSVTPTGGTTFRDWKIEQMRLFGDVVPLVRCHHHPRHLNISVGGDMYWTRLWWEHTFKPDYRPGDERQVEEVPPAPAEEVTPAAPGVKQEAVQPAEGAKRKFDIPEENVQIPERMQPCAASLRKMGEALSQHKNDKGKLPDWLSDLVPDYLSKEALWCPNDTTYTTMTCVDPKLPCSYNYEFSVTEVPSSWLGESGKLFRDWKAEQMKLFGDVVPLVRCHHHGEQHLNLSVRGPVYWSGMLWELTFKRDYRFGEELEVEEAPAPPAEVKEVRPEPVKESGYEKAFRDLYNELGRNYPAFGIKGIDWNKVGEELLPQAKEVKADDEFGLLCLELVARLEDSHAHLMNGTAQVPSVAFPRYDPGFACLIDDRGKPVVYYVDRGGPAEKAGVKVGMAVVSINGEDAEEHMQRRMKEIRKYSGYSSDRYLQYHAAQWLGRQMDHGAMVELEVQDADGETHKFKVAATLGVRYLPRLPVPIPGISDSASVSWKMLGNNIGYIYVRRIRSDLISKLDQAVGALKSARGLVVDVRGNSGGGFDSMRSHRNFSPQERAEPQRPRFKGPIALLIDARCISAGEGWASWFIANKRAKVFGETTAGASSRKTVYTLTNGLFKVRYPVKAYTGFLDRPIERRGLEPDVSLKQNAKDLAARRDAVLEAAKRYLMEKSPDYTATAPSTPAETVEAPVAITKGEEYNPPDFEGYFPDDPEGARKLDAMGEDGVFRSTLPDEELLEIVRRGLRRTRQRWILRAFGNRYIWGKYPQNAKAIEIMYHATDGPDMSNAVYFGLSVVIDKSSSILRALVDICMRSEDPNVLSRVAWGTKSQTSEILTYLTPYLNAKDEATREKAQIVEKILTGELKAFAWAGEKARARAEAFRDKLPEIKEKLLNGDSATRREALNYIATTGITLIMDDSFIEAWEACGADPDWKIRNQVARTFGNHWIWGAAEQKPEAVELMLQLSRDEVREVRYNSVYFGLSTVRDKSEEVVRRLLEIAMEDREWNMFHRIQWGLRGSRATAAKILEGYMDQKETNPKLALAAFNTYEDIIERPPPHPERFQE